ncbi:putative oxidoreductase [Lachnellula suecica]|uniref:Putative oxidoreductase n=1 Tax=Lachnellula suecica TaxID=602035 RepID=A0A8T9C8N1_9HELO|nr:putative oxidoreductase [Lachnellula suecica]
MTFHPDSLPDLKGKVFVVTGGNSGIGYHTVAHLAEHGAHVYLCARSPKKGTEAIAKIKEMQVSTNMNIDLLQIDHMDLASVVAAAKYFLTRETALHGLVNNAGIMATPFEMTKDGYEAQWQTNYLAHWVLTEHLLPLMLRTAKTLAPGSVRIVNLTSSGHLSAPKGGINFDDLSLKDSSSLTRYGQSKLANILHTKSLQTKYGPGSPSARDCEGEIWVSSIHPGMVGTNIATSVVESGSAMASIFSALRMFGLEMPAEKGSYTSLFCVASQEMTAEQSDHNNVEFKSAKEAAFLSLQLIIGAADTSKMSAVSFLEGMMGYPDAQKRGQEEIDKCYPLLESSPTNDPKTKSLVIVYQGTKILRVYPLGHPHRTTRDLEYKQSQESSNSPNVLDRDHFASGAERRICPGYHVADRSLAVSIMRVIWAFEAFAGYTVTPESKRGLWFYAWEFGT